MIDALIEPGKEELFLAGRLPENCLIYVSHCGRCPSLADRIDVSATVLYLLL